MKIFSFLLVLSSVVIWLIYDGSFEKYQVPSRPPFDGSLLPNRALKAVCIFGKPVMVAVLSKDLNIDQVIFAGPVKENPGANSEVFNYVSYSVSLPANQYGDSINVLNSLDEYEEKSTPEKISHYDLLKIDGLPEQFSEVRELLGPWSGEIQRTNPRRIRYVWRKNMCIGERFIFGLWSEVINGKVIKSQGLANKEKLKRLL